MRRRQVSKVLPVPPSEKLEGKMKGHTSMKYLAVALLVASGCSDQGSGNPGNSKTGGQSGSGGSGSGGTAVTVSGGSGGSSSGGSGGRSTLGSGGSGSGGTGGIGGAGASGGTGGETNNPSRVAAGKSRKPAARTIAYKGA